MDISDSGFIAPHTISTKWTDITLFQQRNHNMLYHAKRYGKYFVLKGLSVDGQSLTDHLFLQEKEFAMGVSLSHPHIAETYSLENIEGCGRCIVMEYVDGTTLAEWLTTNPSKAARQRAMMQLLDALEYIHSLQLVHHDLKSSNILITRNGQNVKLIDFGLSQTDAANRQNDMQVDIDKFAQVLSLLFPKRYRCLRQRCQHRQFANLSALRAAIERQERTKKYLPYIVAIIILIISVSTLIHTSRVYQQSKYIVRFKVPEQVSTRKLYTPSEQEQLKQQILEQIDFYLAQEINNMSIVRDTITTLDSYHKNYVPLVVHAATIRDSLWAIYEENDSLSDFFIRHWQEQFGHKYQELEKNPPRKLIVQ